MDTHERIEEVPPVHTCQTEVKEHTPSGTDIAKRKAAFGRWAALIESLLSLSFLVVFLVALSRTPKSKHVQD